MAKNCLKKSLLSKVPEKLATGYTVNQAKRYESITYYIKAAVHNINHNRILVIHVYHRDDLLSGKLEPRFRTFMTKSDYITQYFEEDIFKWLTSRFELLVEHYYYGRKESVFCDTTSEKVVNKYLKYVEGGGLYQSAFQKIQRAQAIIMEKRLEKKHAVIMKRIDHKMRETKPLPKDFDFWIDEIAMAKSRYIYYRYSRRKSMDGYCTHCHQEVKVQGAKHRSTGICPNCGVKVIFLAEGRAKCVFDHGEAAYFQKTPNGFMVRYFSITKSYYGDYRNPKISVTELMRDYYEDGKIFGYEYRQFKQTGVTRWCEGWKKYIFKNAAVYTKNLDGVLRNTKYKYCALKEFANRWDGAAVDPYGYLYRYGNLPEIEYFVKAGLYAITYELTAYTSYTHRVQRNKRSLHEMLGVTKQDFRFIQACDMSFWQVSIYEKLKKVGVHLNVNEFKRFCYTYRDHTNDIFELLRYTTLHKVEKYCCQFVDRQHNYPTVMHIWKDYIHFCMELGYDVKNSFVLFPRSLGDAHRNAYQDLLNKRDKERKDRIRREERKAKRLLKKYQTTYGWEDKKFAVVVPKDLLEIKEEGHILHHCVATYTSKVADGTSIILFVRSLESPEKPFYTMEVRNNKIAQCRGFGNKDMSEDIQKFVNRYEKEVLQKIRERNVA